MIHSHARSGFTLVEVILAIILLSVGVMALAGTSAMVTRMIGSGHQYGVVSQRASARIDRLRQAAASTAPPCISPAFASDSASGGGIGERWTVPPTGVVRPVTVIVSYRTAGGPRSDTTAATILCR